MARYQQVAALRQVGCRHLGPAQAARARLGLRERVGVRAIGPGLRAVAPQPMAGTLAAAVFALEREHLIAAIAGHDTKAAVARALGISRPTLDRKLREHDLLGPRGDR